MTQVRVKGFKIFKDRHGKQRCYHRETGHKVDLTHAPIGSAEFFAECETIRAIAEAQRAKAGSGNDGVDGSPDGIAMCHAGAVKGPTKEWEPSTWRLQHSGSISPS
ncbi:hypothetical protein AB9K34_03860, partial [Sedimentitalea sp. XS_ASV28]|uniref:hypothetical protein n=1 Tax=Sedimentitalea sp. XS_ASV28 TaxID=3241296 RepID=UPI003511B7B7